MRKPSLLLPVLFILSLLCACNKDTEHLGESRMADLLYDLHLAQAVADQQASDSAAYYADALRAAVLQKHGLTEEELAQSLSYYTGHTDKILEVYKLISLRHGQSADGDDYLFQGFGAGGDTLDIWHGASHVLLLAGGQNQATFSLPTDTLVRAGDRLEWHLTTEALYPEGERNAYAHIRMTYADSTATLTPQISGTGRQVIPLPVSSTRKLKHIRISILQNATWSPKPKLLHLSRIHLLRIRPKQEAEKPDSVTQDTIQ